MRFNKFFIAGAMASVLVLSTSCRDDYEDMNQDPANVTKTLPEGLMTAAINAFQPTDYLLWFYNTPYFTRWDQMGTPGGGFSEEYTGMAESGGQGGQYIGVLRYRNKIKKYIDDSGETKYNGYYAATGILTIYLGIFDTDVYRFRPTRHEDKVPAMGWQEVRPTEHSGIFLNGKGSGSGKPKESDYFYFVHSFYVPLCKWTIAEADYILPYSAALHKDNFWSTQFHPEKSGEAGEQLLKNFLAL